MYLSRPSKYYFSLRSSSNYADLCQATEDRVREESFQEQAQGDGTTMNQSTQNDSQQPQNQLGMQMQGLNGVNFGFDGMNNGFPNMAFNNPADFNTMMQFMPNNAMAAFPNMMGEFSIGLHVV